MIPNSVLHTALVLLLFGTTLCSFGADSGPKLRSGKFAITETDRNWWAFQPPRSSKPHKRSEERTANRIDELISAELRKRDLEMNPPASPRELVRRAYFDLLGLPPSAEEVAAFEAQPDDKAWGQ